MIWIGNVPGMHTSTSELDLGDEPECDCGWCICARSSGLFAIGPVQCHTEEERIAYNRTNFVGLYRTRSKPWKNGGRSELRPMWRTAATED